MVLEMKSLGRWFPLVPPVGVGILLVLLLCFSAFARKKVYKSRNRRPGFVGSASALHCATRNTRKEVRRKEQESPTPSTMNGATATLKGKSMFGVQELSRRRTAPAHGFGSSTRNHASKVFMGPEHAKTSSLSCTPGPCYEVNGACGSQYDSGKLSPPQWCFGTAERFSRSSRDKAPGPGAYENAGSFGRQGLSSRTSYPLYGFGTVDRNMASKVSSPQNPCPLLRRRPKGT